jgi:L-asparaginase
MSRVHILATGGTIASRTDPATGAVVPAITADELIASVPELVETAEVTVEEVTHVSSWDITLEMMAHLAHRIAELATEEDAPDGFVVTHGTDTMEETAFALDILCEVEQPIVLTGAMRPVDSAEADGPGNLVDAIDVAVTEEARRVGAVVVMAGEIHAARYVTKAHTSRVDALASLARGAIGVVDEGDVSITTRVERGPKIPLAEPSPDVHLVTSVADLDPRLLSIIGALGPRGLVLSGTGAGNIPARCVPAVRDLLGAGTVVVLTSRCGSGPVHPTYGGGGGGGTLAALGVVPGGDLSGPKARVALSFALGAGMERSRFASWSAQVSDVPH